MLKRLTTILIILNFMSVSHLFGQDKLMDNIISDIMIKKLKIKQVTENWFHDSDKTSPANTTIEKYNETGQRIQRIHINYDYHKFIHNYSYNLKKGFITETQEYYDYKHNRKTNKVDTILKKSIRKYDIATKRNIKYKPSGLDKFRPRETTDSFGRITERIDTIKFGYYITYYTYDKNEKIVERKHYISHHSEKPYLYAVDSLHYNLNGQLVKETNYYDITMNEDKWKFDREVITTYSYIQNGLIIEKTNVTIHHSLTSREFKPTIYRYEYEFY